jgi:putative ABC transport system permease protein
VQYDFVRDGQPVFQSATAFPRVGPALLDEMPEVDAYARLYLRYGGAVVRVDDQSFDEAFLFQADPSFLTLFSYPMRRVAREVLPAVEFTWPLLCERRSRHGEQHQ